MKFSNDFLSQLNSNLKQPLPGKTAQYKMAHVGRDFPTPSATNAKQACVMALLYPDQNNETHIVLIERVSHAKDRHSGQIGFPGGKLEPEDESLKAGALREVEEEIGVNPNNITILGRLSELHISVSNFMVHPFVGYTKEQPDFTIQETEVADILEVPLRVLMDEKTKKTKDLKLPNGIKLKEVPYFDVNNHTVWGATAMMLNELIEIMNYEL